MIPIFRRPQSRTLKPSKWILGTAGLQTRPSTNHRRVVITGVGAVTSLGRTFPETWEGVLKGDSGAKVLNETEYDDFPCRVGARVDFDEFEDGTWVGTHGDLKRTPKVVRMALAAAHEALRQANWMPEAGKDRDNTALVIGSSVGSLQDWYDHSTTLHDQSYRGFSHMFLPRTLTNIPVGAVATEFGFRGPISCPSTACTTGTVAIGEAYRLIEHGYAEVALAGGADATVTPLALAGFGKLRALPKFASLADGDPKEICKSFDVDRNGLLVGEGAALVVLEDLEHAKSRGVTILGEVIGFGSAADAFHPVRPDPNGTGAVLSMTRALEDAGRTIGFSGQDSVPRGVGYVNAHATATLAGDEAELLAISKVLGSSGTEPLYVSSCKPSIGHCMGAAGAVELILTLWALRNRTLPHTLNLRNPITPEPTTRPIVLLKGRPLSPHEFPFAMSNSFGFGGGNATLVVGLGQEL